MIWKFISSGINNGSYNMDFDMMLAKSLNSNEAILRLYQWKPYCISLGTNQSEGSLKLEKIITNNIDVVKRPTGGRAILHSEELTYSVIYPIGKRFSPKELYREINLALKNGLIMFNSILENIKLEYVQPYFPTFYKKDKSTVCFAVSSENEINFEGKKMVGSAQRKMRNVILQHGSILCGGKHKEIIEYLNLPEESLRKIRNEMNNNTTDLNEILNVNINIERLISSIKRGFEIHFNFVFENSEQKSDLVLSFV
ncbi:MAG: lipoate--protein ligase family protein [Ignavibacteria bacterium]|nr:MAG: lipoate--protein ligase family protein [Ignavibacteria bacterium]